MRNVLRPVFVGILLAAPAALPLPPASAQEALDGEEAVTTKSLREALVSEAVLIVYGTGGDDATTAALRQHAEQLAERLEGKMEGRGWPITLRADSDVDLPELGGTLLFLVGTPDSNVLLTLYQGKFPVHVDDAGVTVGRERFEGPDVATTFAMVNPFNPEHYAVVCTGVTDAAIWNAPEYTYDEIGYVVVNGDRVLARGQFDTTIPEYWTILPGAGVDDVAEQVKKDARPLGLDFRPDGPLPGFDGHAIFLLGYGPQDGTVELQAFLMPYLRYLHESQDVRLVGLEAPLWMSSFLDGYVIDGKAPPDGLVLPEETAAFVEELRAYNRGLAADRKVHLATFDLNHDVFGPSGEATLLPLKTRLGALRDRETRKQLSSQMAEVTAAFEGGTPAAMLQALDQLNASIAVAALRKKVPADDFAALRAYLDTQKTSIFFHQPENRERRGTAALEEARARILRQNVTAVVERTRAELGGSVLLFLADDHCNKGAPGPAYGRIPLASYFERYYEPTWEQVHVTVAYACSGGFYCEAKRSLEVIPDGFTPDEFESLAGAEAHGSDLVFIPFSDPFWSANRMTIGHTWTWPARLYDAMVFFSDVHPASGQTRALAR